MRHSSQHKLYSDLNLAGAKKTSFRLEDIHRDIPTWLISAIFWNYRACHSGVHQVPEFPSEIHRHNSPKVVLKEIQVFICRQNRSSSAVSHLPQTTHPGLSSYAHTRKNTDLLRRLKVNLRTHAAPVSLTQLEIRHNKQ